MYNLVTNYMSHFCDNPDLLTSNPDGIEIDVEEEIEKCHNNFALLLSIVNKKNAYVDGEYYNTADRYLPV